jgi:hypothetical protein
LNSVAYTHHELEKSRVAVKKFRRSTESNLPHAGEISVRTLNPKKGRRMFHLHRRAAEFPVEIKPGSVSVSAA